MDAFHEQKAIAKQNRDWAEKKRKRKNNLEKHHLWMQSDGEVKRKRDKMWNNIIMPENEIR